MIWPTLRRWTRTVMWSVSLWTVSQRSRMSCERRSWSLTHVAASQQSSKRRSGSEPWRETCLPLPSTPRHSQPPLLISTTSKVQPAGAERPGTLVQCRRWSSLDPNECHMSSGRSARTQASTSCLASGCRRSSQDRTDKPRRIAISASDSPHVPPSSSSFAGSDAKARRASTARLSSLAWRSMAASSRSSHRADVSKSKAMSGSRRDASNGSVIV